MKLDPLRYDDVIPYFTGPIINYRRPCVGIVLSFIEFEEEKTSKKRQ
jgi:hypothetical protein